MAVQVAGNCPVWRRAETGGQRYAPGAAQHADIMVRSQRRSPFSGAPERHRLPAKVRTVPTDARVIKKLAPEANGAKNLSAQYGASLVCVRHRLDDTGTQRITTVELVVAVQPIRRRPGPTVDVRVLPKERALQAKLKQAGARWHETEAVWSLRRSTAIALGLNDRIVPRQL